MQNSPDHHSVDYWNERIGKIDDSEDVDEPEDSEDEYDSGGSVDSGDSYRSAQYDEDESNDSPQARLDEYEAKVPSMEVWISCDQCVDILTLSSKLDDLAKACARLQDPKLGTLACARLPQELRDIVCNYLWTDDARHLADVDKNKIVTYFLDKQYFGEPLACDAAQ